MVDHFCFGDRKLAVGALLDVLDAVVVVQLEGLLGNLFGAITSNNRHKVNNLH